MSLKIPMFVAVTLLMGATLAISESAQNIAAVELPHALAGFPEQVLSWNRVAEQPLSPEEIDILKPTSAMIRVYSNPESSLTFLMAYFSRQRPGEAIHSPKNCLPNSWTPVESFFESVQTNGQTVPVNVYRIQNENDKRVMLYWYQSTRRIVASEYGAKFYLLEDSLFARRSDGLLARVEISERVPDALSKAKTFAAAAIPQIQRLLQ
jgi:EpsI family protein